METGSHGDSTPWTAQMSVSVTDTFFFFKVF